MNSSNGFLLLLKKLSTITNRMTGMTMAKFPTTRAWMMHLTFCVHLMFATRMEATAGATVLRHQIVVGVGNLALQSCALTVHPRQVRHFMWLWWNVFLYGKIATNVCVESFHQTKALAQNAFSTAILLMMIASHFPAVNETNFRFKVILGPFLSKDCLFFILKRNHFLYLYLFECTYQQKK